MSNLIEKQKLVACMIMLLCLFAFFAAGCQHTAFSTLKMSITHDPLTQVSNADKGTILVKSFTDKRPENHKGKVGVKRDSGIPVGSIVLNEGEQLEPIITKCFAKALGSAGYQAIIEGEQSSPGNYDAILVGEINKFWADAFINVDCSMDIGIKILDKNSTDILWARNFTSVKKNFNRGFSTVPPETIHEAFSEILQQAVLVFSSDEFAKNIGQ